MAIGLRLNSNRDLYLDSDGNIATTSGLSTVVQNCETAARTQLGEMIFYVNNGMPNQQVTWIGQPRLQQFEASLKSILLNVDDVTDVSGMSTQIIDNVLFYSVNILTTFGSSVLNGSI